MKRIYIGIVLVVVCLVGFIWTRNAGVFAEVTVEKGPSIQDNYPLKPTYTPPAVLPTAALQEDSTEGQVEMVSPGASSMNLVIPAIDRATVSGIVEREPPALVNGLRQALPIIGSGEHLVAIDPGHGGIDEGTYPYNPDGTLSYNEKQINLAIALRLCDILVANNVRVFLVRNGDYEVNPDWLDVNGDGLNDLGDESQARLDLINASGAELLLALHQNARTFSDGSVDPEYSGSTTYYCADRPFSDASYRFAKLVHSEVLEGLAAVGYDSYDQGVIEDLSIDEVEPKRHLILLGPVSDRIARPSQMPAALDEPLFATNYTESVLLSQPEIHEALAQAYARAVIRYFYEADAE